MEITTALIAKITGSFVLLSGGVIGIYFGQDYLNNSISKYDTALIDFLEKGNGNNDIIFEVKKGEDGTEDLSENDISLSGSNSPLTAKVQIAVNTSNTNTTFKTNGSATNENDLKAIKQLNKTESNGWTWKCLFKFEVEGTDANGKSIKDDYKNRIWKNPNLGFFGLLKKDASNYTNSTDSDKTSKWTKEEIIQTKIDFIKKCGWERGLTKNKQLNKEQLGSDGVKGRDISIKFKVKENDLVPESESIFDYWFIKKEDKDKTYHSTTTGS